MENNSQIQISEIDFQRITKKLRERIIKTSASAKIPHLGSCLSCLEILAFT